MAKPKITSIGEKLRDIQAQIALKMEEIKPLEEAEENLREQLLQQLSTQGWKHIKLDSGEIFTKAVRQTIKIVDEVKAIAWATKHNAIKVDTTKAKEILRHEMETPSWMEYKETEYLSVRKEK